MTARKGVYSHRSEQQEAQLSTWPPGEGPESLRDREDSGNTGHSTCLAVLWLGVTRLCGSAERTEGKAWDRFWVFLLWSLLADPGPGMRQENTEPVGESSGLAGFYITGASEWSHSWRPTVSF